MKLLCLALICAPSFVFATCPPVPERTATQDDLMAQLKVSPDEATAREINNQLWEIWTVAPDEAAQQILQRGMERRASYDYLGAIQDFDALVEYCPHYAEGYNQRAFVHFLRGAYPLALADLERALAITPDHIGAASGKALSLLHMGRDVEGQLALRHALTMHPWLSERALLKPLPDLPAEGKDTDL